MPLTATRLAAIQAALYSDLERGLVRINRVLAKIAPHIPDDCHVSFDVQHERITVEGERKCPQNLLMAQLIAAEYGVRPSAHYIGDGWDSEMLTPHPDFVCIWVTNISEPTGGKPSL